MKTTEVQIVGRRQSADGRRLSAYRRRMTLIWCVLGAFLGVATLSAQPDPWIAKSTRIKVRSLKDSSGRVRIEYPEKDWLIVPGGTSMLMALAEKRAEASVFVEASELRQPLAPEEVTDLFATIEVETIQQRDPSATGFAKRIVDSNGRRIVAVEYTRVGHQGPERVRQYSYPIGSTLYRIICTTPPAQVDKYAQTFAHVAATFAVAQ